jgi:acyl-coenzyme A thioesterase PaaI-like protein
MNTEQDGAASLQDRYSPLSVCFGCGPANDKGLQLKSYLDGDDCVARFRPQPHHQAFPGVLNGGIIGTILDCHCNWTAAYALMIATGATKVPGTVTADYAIKLKRPTPMDGVITAHAKVVEVSGNRAVVEGTLEAGGQVTATCRGTFVAVGPGHPAYGRW